MRRAEAHKEALRAFSVGILAVFVLGSASGPLRTCLSHPAHASGAQGGVQPGPMHAATQHANAPMDHAPASDHEGCSCLGRCSLENAPGLPGSFGPMLAHSPDVPRALVAYSVRIVTEHDRLDLPLARPPPAVV